MPTRFPFALTVSLVCSLAFAHAIPRTPTQHYRTEGFFEGGVFHPANLETVRLAEHDGFERWVIDFSDPKSRTLGDVAPRFQLRYYKLREGGETGAKPARFVFLFRGIQKNYLTRTRVQALTRKSHFVQDVVLYPPIEDGDMALEMVLKKDVRFEPHQPKEKEGRLVLDLKDLSSPNT